MTGREVSISIRVTTIRDGTDGISMSAPDRILGEWQDSGAVSLAIKEDYAIDICGKDGKHRYCLKMPGTPLHGKLVSDTEAVVTIQM